MKQKVNWKRKNVQENTKLRHFDSNWLKWINSSKLTDNFCKILSLINLKVRKYQNTKIFEMILKDLSQNDFW